MSSGVYRRAESFLIRAGIRIKVCLVFLLRFIPCLAVSPDSQAKNIETGIENMGVKDRAGGRSGNIMLFR